MVEAPAARPAIERPGSTLLARTFNPSWLIRRTLTRSRSISMASTRVNSSSSAGPWSVLKSLRVW